MSYASSTESVSVRYSRTEIVMSLIRVIFIAVGGPIILFDSMNTVGARHIIELIIGIISLPFGIAFILDLIRLVTAFVGNEHNLTKKRLFWSSTVAYQEIDKSEEKNVFDSYQLLKLTLSTGKTWRVYSTAQEYGNFVALLASKGVNIVKI